MSGFVVAPLPEEFRTESDVALTRQLTQEDVLNSMRTFGIVVNSRLEDSLVIYSLD